MDYRAIRTSNEDNVAVAVKEIPPGVSVKVPGHGQVTTNQNIPFGHKLALSSIPRGTSIVRYGEVICHAKHDIKPGDWVHIHNCLSDI